MSNADLTGHVFTAVHASGKYSRRTKATLRAWDRYAVKGWASIITITECSGADWTRTMQVFCNRHHGWKWARSNAGAGARETAIMWDTAVWDEVKPVDARRVSNLRYRRVTGRWTPYFHASVQPLRHRASGRKVTFVVYHAPLSNTPRRGRVQADCRKGLGKLVRSLGGDVVLLGDFNENLRRDRIRSRIWKLTGLTSTWEWGIPGRVYPRIRRFRGRIIDGIYSSLKSLGCEMMYPYGGSDHYAVRSTLIIEAD